MGATYNYNYSNILDLFRIYDILLILIVILPLKNHK